MKDRKITLLVATASGILLCVDVVYARPLPQTQSPVVINEVQVDPASGIEGDANGDGVRDTYEDEFIELLNRSPSPADISGFELGAAGADLFVFATGTILAPGEYLVVFGGGTPAGIPGRAFTAGGRLGSGLTNTAGRLLLVDPSGPDTLQDVSYQDWDVDGAFTRDPEGWGNFAEHLLVSGARFSPAGPALPGGGPDQSMPTAYRLRVVNLTSAGYQLAWRTSVPADGRLEVNTGDYVRHRYDPMPSGLLHLAGIYGLEPRTPTTWRVVSGGTSAPSDSFESLITGHVVTSVPYTVYGTVVDGASGNPVDGAHVFLRSRKDPGSSGWLAAVTDSLGRWDLNLGNLRTMGGEGYTWSAGDTLVVEADGGLTGVASTEVLVDGVSPQEVTLSGVEHDSPPVFSWDGFPAGSSADTVMVLGYSLTDEGQAWARVFLREDGQDEKIAAETEPSLLPASADGSVHVDVSDLPEGSQWWITALVEDGLNPPIWIETPQPLRISHAVTGVLPVTAGIVLFTPTLDDPSLYTAYEWLGRLPSVGELARWDLPTASWESATRLSGGTLTGGDFQLTAGEGYALVSAVAGSLQVSGPRRYLPPVYQTGTGLALVGVSDSSLVRSADEVIAGTGIRAVSRWDVHSQSWQGRFRLPGGERVGDDFQIGWGEAVAVDLDSAIAWQPVGNLRATGDGRVSGVLTRAGKVKADGPGSTASLLAAGTDPGCVELLWRAPAGAFLRLESETGTGVWHAHDSDGEVWSRTRVVGLPPGNYKAVLRINGPEGQRRLIQQARVQPVLPPPLPVWAWGPHPPDPGILLLEVGDAWIPARIGMEGIWYSPLNSLWTALLGERPAAFLVELADDGGWTRWPLVVADTGNGQMAFGAGGAPIALGGLQVEVEGPLSIKLRWQVLHGEEAIAFQTFLGYDSPRGGGGPGGDPGKWVPSGQEIAWEPGRPPVIAQRVRLDSGLEGRFSAGAVAVRVITAGGEVFWLGPEALAVPGDAEELMLLPAAPNPFNPETTLRYVLPPGGTYTVRMEIRDVRGRRTVVLVDSEQVAGSYMVRWDGRDETGHIAAAGVYLVVLQVDGRRLSRKILLLR